MPDIFPKYRHIVVVGDKRFPTQVLSENAFTFNTPLGHFSKLSRTKVSDPSIRFEGPFTAEGDMENRP